MDAGNRLALFVDHATDDAFVATHAQLDYLRRLARLYAIQDRNIALGFYSNHLIVVSLPPWRRPLQTTVTKLLDRVRLPLPTDVLQRIDAGEEEAFGNRLAGLGVENFR